jgi:hypothetical protein
MFSYYLQLNILCSPQVNLEDVDLQSLGVGGGGADRVSLTFIAKSFSHPDLFLQSAYDSDEEGQQQPGGVQCAQQ